MTTEPAGTAEAARVAAGAAYLDERAPGWWQTWANRIGPTSSAALTFGVHRFWGELQREYKLPKLADARLTKLGFAVDGWWEEGSVAEADSEAVAHAWWDLVRRRENDRETAQRQAFDEVGTWDSDALRSLAYHMAARDPHLILEYAAEQREADGAGRDRKPAASGQAHPTGATTAPTEHPRRDTHGNPA
jgi:hypothetical protein